MFARRLRIVGVLVVAWVVVFVAAFVFVAAGVEPKTTSVILENAMGGRALRARIHVPGQSAEEKAPTSVGLSFLEAGSVGAPGTTGKLGLQFGVQLLPAGSTLDGEPFFRKEFSRGGVMVP